MRQTFNRSFFLQRLYNIVFATWPDGFEDHVENRHPQQVHDQGEHCHHLKEQEDLSSHC